MREIKFRGQLFSGKWVYGYYAVLLLDGHDTDFIYNGTWNEVKHGTVGQYIDLHDKNSVEIYEGDIVRILYTDWCSQSFASTEKKLLTHEEYLKSISDIGKVIYETNQFTLDIGSIFAGTHGFIEVIGNIYENPELLERNK